MNGYIRRRPARSISQALHDFDAEDGSHYLRATESHPRGSVLYCVARYHDDPGPAPRSMSRDEVQAVLREIGAPVDTLTLYQHEKHWEAY